MNILVIAHYQGDGSPSANFVHEQVKEYIHLGNNVLVLIPIPFLKSDFKNRRISQIIDKDFIDGVECVFFRFLSLSNFGEASFNGWSANIIIDTFFDEIVDAFKPDIIHAHTFSVDTEIALRLKKKLKLPCVVTCHGTDFLKIKESFDRDTLTKRWENIDQIVVVSDKLKTQIMNYCNNISPLVIYNGANLGLSEEHTNKDIDSIIFVGNLIKQKNADIVIKATYELTKGNPNISLKIVGKGVEEDNLKSLCAKLNMKNVSFLGYQDNKAVLELMQKSEYFIMPSVREAFGIVYIEAMSSGCITIGTKREGIDGIIIDGENGFLVEPNVEDIKIEIMKCMRDNRLKQRIVNCAIETASRFTWKNNASTYISLFENIVNN